MDGRIATRRVLVGLAAVTLLAGCTSSAPSSSVAHAAPTPTVAPIVAPTTPGASGSGSMTIARDRHVATRLLDGRVLLVGGYAIHGPDPGASAELYDPATGTFSPTGSMATTRVFTTATRLADGRVLIVGGDGFLGPLASAELYDPATGTFSPTGSMATTRVSHAAALLPDGRVLIAGGQGISGSSGVPPALASAELYDPATGTFSPTGSMATSRCGHAAALLPDGRVLIVGGSGEIGGSSGELQDLASAELYDPATGTFSPTGRTAAAGPVTATSLRDGRILIAGGYDGPCTRPHRSNCTTRPPAGSAPLAR